MLLYLFYFLVFFFTFFIKTANVPLSIYFITKFIVPSKKYVAKYLIIFSCLSNDDNFTFVPNCCSTFSSSVYFIVFNANFLYI